MTVSFPKVVLPEEQDQRLQDAGKGGRIDFTKIIQPVGKHVNNKSGRVAITQIRYNIVSKRCSF